MRKSLFFSFSLASLIAACGGSEKPPVTADNTNVPTPPSSASAAPTPSATPAPSSSAALPSISQTGGSSGTPAVDPGTKPKDYEDPHETEHGSTVTMAPLFAKSAPKSTFPKRSVGDKECWQGTSLAGDAKKDFAALVAKCGTPTGLAEYAKPVIGKLHHVHDKRDTYKLKLAGGMCYRYFAVADAGIKDLDILVTKPNGALIADDKTSNPVAIIEFDKSWCMEDDAEYDFHIEVDGEGTGNYMFGVWAKPKGNN